MRVSESTWGSIAVFLTVIYSIILIIATFAIVFAGFGSPGLGWVLLIIAITIALLVLVFKALFSAYYSRGWAIVLLVFGVLYVISAINPIRITGLVTSLSYFIYAVQCLKD